MTAGPSPHTVGDSVRTHMPEPVDDVPIHTPEPMAGDVPDVPKSDEPVVEGTALLAAMLTPQRAMEIVREFTNVATLPNGGKQQWIVLEYALTALESFVNTPPPLDRAGRRRAAREAAKANKPA